MAAEARLASGTAGLAAGRMTRGEGLRGGVEGEEKTFGLAASGEDGMAPMIFTATSTPSGTQRLPVGLISEEPGAGVVGMAATAAAAELAAAAEAERDCEGVTGTGTGALGEVQPPMPPFFSASACIFAALEFFHTRGDGQ